MIVTRTPVRIPLGGGGTDLPSYSGKYGGFLVSAAIDKYTYITVNPRKLDRLIRASYSKTELVESVDEVQHPLVREALRLTGIDGGIEVHSIGDVPGGSGMGSSGSFTVGLLNALHTLKREHVSAVTLAEEACHIEMDILGEPIGKHDQYLAALGGVTCLDIDRTGHVSAFPARISTDALEEFERSTLLFYTGIARKASEVLAEQNKSSQQDDPRVIANLHRIKEIGAEVLRALENGDLHRFGELLHEHWQSKKQLSGKISGDQIDRWYEVAREHGAVGGKIMGAGGGGFFMFYCEHQDKVRLRAALAGEGLLEMRFRFDLEGSKVLVNL
jgi:D-glycero-alpha-D-manno-heptose-7-phosphate kinase